MKLPILGLTLFALIAIGCGKGNKKSEIEKQSLSSEYIYLNQENLELLGIHVKDNFVMYKNSIEGVGALDLTIRDKSYYGNEASIEQTHHDFYPRYITTLDTVQRTMYRLKGNQTRSEEEAQKWQDFETLVPVVVEQKQNDSIFGETLVFWMTKTPELEKLLAEIKEE